MVCKVTNKAKGKKLLLTEDGIQGKFNTKRNNERPGFYFIKDKNILKFDLGTITLDYCSYVRLKNILIFYEIEPWT